jgi:hypothetical protein
MTPAPAPGDAPPPPAVATWADQVCDRFEDAWGAGLRPRLEDYLAAAPEGERLTLAYELIALEAHYRRLSGEDPRPEDYRPRFPALDPARLAEAVAARAGAGSGPPAAPTKPSGGEGAAEHPAVPGYEILGLLGRGGMGVVYQARDLRLRRTVALKMLLDGAHAGAQDLERFRAEAEAQARLRHPNIVQIYEVGEAQGRPYFALEFVEGGSLARKLAGKPQPPAAAAQLIETLARAVHHAHQQGVVHRDLKPLNALLTADGTPKITDFGLAKRLEGGGGQTRSGLVLGTPSYMAPEQAAGQTKRIGPATDVYALGVVLYEALTGRPPFLAETTLQTVLQVQAQEPVPPRRLQPKVPRDLETVCLKCLQKEPARRYASAEALAEDLRRFRAGEPIQARPVGPVERLGRWCRRNPALAAAGGLAATALVAVTVLSLLFALHKARAQEQAAADLRKSQLLSAEKTFGQGTLLCKQGEVALGMLWFARGLEEAPPGSDDLQRLLRANLAGWRRQLYPMRGCLEHPDRVFAVAVSPDGRTLATGCGNTARLWQDGEASRTLAHEDQVRAVAFSPDLILMG